jgi:hypothetical protein
MREQMEIQHLNGKCVLLVVLLCFLIPSGEELYGASLFKLTRQGYSPTTKTLLIANGGDGGKRPWLATYEQGSDSVGRVALPGKVAPCDFAWVPGRAAFVVTNLEGMFLFQKDDSREGYTATAIAYPPGPLPFECSWSPKGEWLVVNCLNEENLTRGALWLYRLGDKALVETGLAVDYLPVTWGNDVQLYGTKDNEVLIIELTGGKPRVVRTVPLGEQHTLFYGMFGEQPLFQAGREVRLGNKTLMVLDQPSKFRVMATEKTIFVSVSSKCLGAFDTAGHEIARSDPGRLIKFGSVKDANTVYGLADDSLVCVSVVQGALKIQTVADLDKMTKTGLDH